MIGISESQYESQVEKWQTVIEFWLGVVIPSVFSIMLYSYLIFPLAVQWLFGTSLVIALFLLVPAKKLHDLHFHCWSTNVMPIKIITGMVGMIYITVISIFTISLLSIYKGLEPNEPTTAVVLVVLLAVLIVLLALHSKYKERFLSSEKRFFATNSFHIERIIIEFLERSGERYMRYPQETGLNVHLDAAGLTVRVLPLWNGSSEVIIENIEAKNLDTLMAIKSLLREKV
ncbi:MAG: hypothetical protein QXN93_03910 [Methanomassiliicoccales archaeon]